LVLVFGSTNASAEPKVGVDAQVDVPVGPSAISSGYAGGIRVGYEVNATVVTLMPEIGGAYHKFGGDMAPGILQGFVGARVGTGSIVRSSVFGHLGYANVRNDNAPNRSASTLDGGLAFDFVGIPKIDLGVHGAYNVVTGNSDGAAIKWVSAGVHVQVAF